ncbi:MAG: hypothetical protein RI958_2964 [Actinomycetota bacterium]
MFVEPASSSAAPPVVAVMVAHRPGPWFDDAVAALARQDYPNLKALVLVVGDPAGVAERVLTHLPNAFVREVAGDPGFGATATEVLRLVEGTNGFFCFLHDDVALDPDAIRLLVEEIYRSNAGIVGPKLVHWDQPNVLQHVGYGVDRFGDVDPIVEPGETDQEQHDAVRDVFALPSACLLVRADLFASLGGFDPEFGFHGDDVDLCWRAHLQGARVVVVPSARGRHRERLVERRPDLAHVTMREQHRLWSAVTLTGARRLPLLVLQLVFVTLAQFVVGLFSGQAARGWAGVRALFGLVPRVPAIVRRRRDIAGTRSVPDREVVGLQVRGVARVTAYLRARDARPDLVLSSGKAWRERSGGTAALGLAALVLAVVIGGRHLVSGGVPHVGEFLPYPESPAQLLRSVAHGWNAEGLGASTAQPTGIGVIGLLSVVTLFRMALLHTLGVIGLLVVGVVGMWRLTSAFSSTRARLAASVVYFAVPLPAELVSVGRWRALLVYATLPWTIDALRRYSGLVSGPADTEGERTVGFDARRHVRLLAAAALTVGIGAAFETSYPLVVVAVGVVMSLATLLTGAPLAASIRLAAGGAIASVVGAVLCFPWMAAVVSNGGWGRVVGPQLPGDRGNSVVELLSFDLGNTAASVFALALFLPVFAAPLIGRGWRLGWAARGGLLVVVFAWLAVLDDGGTLPFRLPEPGIVLAPVAVGVALSAGCLVGSLELDIRGGSFGWRQPLAVLAGLAMIVGVVPGVLALGDGRWKTPTTTLVDLLGWFPDDGAGEYRVMWIGDQRVVPAAPRGYTPGVGVALTDGGDLDVADAWSAPPSEADDDVTAALDAIALGTTTRGGRLLAPFAVRYVVVPVVDGAASTNTDPLPLPAGLIDALGDQLDLAPVYSPPNFLVYENRAWVPIRSVLTARGAEASQVAGPEALAQADLSGATPMAGGDGDTGAPWHMTDGVIELSSPSTVHVAVPFDRHWRLEIDGTEVEERPAFGSTAAYDVEAAGVVTLGYETPTSHRLQLLVQALLWLAVGAAASGLRARRRPQTRAELVGALGEPVLSFDPLVPTASPSTFRGDEPVGDVGPSAGEDGS